MNLIGICGKAGSGKSTVADILARDHAFVVVSLADPMKRACADWFGWGIETLWGPSTARNEPHARLGGLTARKALQQLGTEFGRACYVNVWINLALRTADSLLIGEKYRRHSYTPERGLFDRGEGGGPETIEGVVIPDVRFVNERNAIRAAGGVIWKTTHGSGLEGSAGAHESEQYIDSLEADATIPDSPLEALPMIITTMLKGASHG
jgi:hypothetical protein